MPFEEYAAQPFMENHEHLKYMNKICLAKINGQYSGFTAVPVSSNFTQNKSYMYLNSGDLERSNS